MIACRSRKNAVELITMMGKEYLRTPEVCRLLGVTRQAVNYRVHRGKLKAHKLNGRESVWSTSDIWDWMESRQEFERIVYK